MEISSLTKKRIEELLKEGKRLDRRKPLEFRDITIEQNVSNKAEGSARVKIGDTEVIAGVKLSVMEPFPDTPDAGALMVGAELSPLASDKFELGPPGIRAIELARIIDRGIRESEFIDLKKLCIKKNELVWAVFIDIYPINYDGNLIDASALAAIAALHNAVFPKIKNDKVQFGELTNKSLPLKDTPITITFYKINNTFILDPVMEEEEAAQGRVSMALTFKKEEFLHAIQKAGDEALDEKEVLEVIELASKEGKKLYNKIKTHLKIK